MLNRGTGEGKLGSHSQLGNIITFAVGTFFIAHDDFKSYVSFFDSRENSVTSWHFLNTYKDLYRSGAKTSMFTDIKIKNQVEPSSTRL